MAKEFKADPARPYVAQLSALDMGQLDNALTTHISTLKRAINSERDEEARRVREKRLAEYSALQNFLRVLVMEAS